MRKSTRKLAQGTTIPIISIFYQLRLQGVQEAKGKKGAPFKPTFRKAMNEQ